MARRRNQTGNPSQRTLHSLRHVFHRLDPRVRLVVLAVLLVLGIVAALTNYQQPQQNPPPLPQSTTAVSLGEVNLLLGNPSSATTDPANRNNYLMVKEYYALAYNNAAGTPNWVSWRLTKADQGDAPRKRLFDADTALPPGFKRITHQDYSGSGFDRGHLCPHSDRDASEEMSSTTFVMTNIIPQAPNVNQRAWAQLEAYCRGLVHRQNMRLFIIAGPTGKGGRGSAGFKQTIASGRVTVPAQCWKVVVMVPDSGGSDDLAKISTATRIITVMLPNDNETADDDWAKYRTSAADVERQTGLRFFDRLPSDVAQVLRQKVDNTPIAQ